VSTGKTYYSKGATYEFFAGKDASPCFTSGQFNDEGMKQELNDLEDSQIHSILHWCKFYREHQTYVFVGVLNGIFYNEKGQPTDLLTRCLGRLEKIEEGKETSEL
jgi:hypothetical protein